MSENSESTQNQEQISSSLEVIRLNDPKEWTELLTQYKEREREVIHSGMNTYDIYDNNQVIMNKGAAPCLLAVVYQEPTETVGVGHYIVGNGNYDEFLKWISEMDNPETREVHIFGQSFPSALHSSAGIDTDRIRAIDDLRNIANLEESQIYDHREKNRQTSGTDNVIVNTKDKKIYFYRTKSR